MEYNPYIIPIEYTPRFPTSLLRTSKQSDCLAEVALSYLKSWGVGHAGLKQDALGTGPTHGQLDGN